MLSTMLAKLRIGPFHWRAIAPWRAARLAVGVLAPLIFGWATGHIEYGAFAALGALPAGFAAYQGVTRSRIAAIARNPARSRNWNSNKGRSEANPIASRPLTSTFVKASTAMKTGTDSIAANGVSPPRATCAARTARLPVMWAVKRPSPRKLMTSTLPAMTLSTPGSSFVPSVLSTEGANSRAVLSSASGDITDHLFRIDAFVELFLVDVPRLKRRLLLAAPACCPTQSI